VVGWVGNYFNNEIYGGCMSLLWGLWVYEWDMVYGWVVIDVVGYFVLLLGVYYLMFFYELLWCLIVVGVVVLFDCWLWFDYGCIFVFYVMFYMVGCFWIELLCIDIVNFILGYCFNEWMSIFVFLGVLVGFLLVSWVVC